MLFASGIAISRARTLPFILISARSNGLPESPTMLSEPSDCSCASSYIWIPRSASLMGITRVGHSGGGLTDRRCLSEMLVHDGGVACSEDVECALLWRGSGRKFPLDGSS